MYSKRSYSPVSGPLTTLAVQCEALIYSRMGPTWSIQSVPVRYLILHRFHFERLAGRRQTFLRTLVVRSRYVTTAVVRPDEACRRPAHGDRLVAVMSTTNDHRSSDVATIVPYRTVVRHLNVRSLHYADVYTRPDIYYHRRVRGCTGVHD